MTGLIKGESLDSERDMHRKKIMWRHRETSIYKPRNVCSYQKLWRAIKLSLTVSAGTKSVNTLLWTSSLQKCKTINFCYVTQYVIISYGSQKPILIPNAHVDETGTKLQ